jgi:hypothetical protein
MGDGFAAGGGVSKFSEADRCLVVAKTLAECAHTLDIVGAWLEDHTRNLRTAHGDEDASNGARPIGPGPQQSPMRLTNQARPDRHFFPNETPGVLPNKRIRRRSAGTPRRQRRLPILCPVDRYLRPNQGLSQAREIDCARSGDCDKIRRGLHWNTRRCVSHQFQLAAPKRTPRPRRDRSFESTPRRPSRKREATLWPEY